MKIVLINPPQIFSKTQVAASVIPPLGLMYLSAFLKKHGHSPVLIDSIVEDAANIYRINDSILCRGLSFNNIISRIPADTGLIGITNLFSFAYPLVVELTGEIKKAYPEIPIVVGGAHPSATPVETVSCPTIDFVVISEGEETIIQLVNNLDNYEVLKKIDGIAYKDHNGAPLFNPKTKFIEDLDNLPFPDRDIIPLERYFKINEAHGPNQNRWTPILSSRGCPYQCTFCTPQLWNRRYRVRSSENVLTEVEDCVKKYNITEFHFEDENLTINKKRIIAICNGIKERKLNILWQTPNGIRASVTDEEMLKAMKESGCYHITVAPESGSERVLNEIIKKKQDLSRVQDVIQQAKQYGLYTAAYFVIGLPGETVDELKMTINYACKLAKVGLDEVAFSNFIPLPGSELYGKLMKEGKFIANWSNYVSIGDLSKSTSWSENISSKELKKLRMYAYLRFHMTKMLYHPIKVIKSFINVLRKKQELKTERTLLSFIKRLRLTYH